MKLRRFRSLELNNLTPHPLLSKETQRTIIGSPLKRTERKEKYTYAWKFLPIELARSKDAQRR